MNDFIDKLITAVEARPGLWDSRLPLGARDKNKRATLWQEVAAELGNVLSDEEVKKKFRNLRDRYVRELNNSKLPSESGVVKRKTWVHLHKLHFINDTVAYGPVTSNIPSLDAAEEELVDEQDTELVDELDLGDDAPVTMEDRQVNMLISAVEARPGLWDSRLPLGARDKITRVALWQQVVNELGGASGFGTVDEVKRKFKSLRDRYIREKNSNDIGAIKRKSWVHLHKLQFLNGTVEHVPAESVSLFKNEVDLPMDHAYGLPDDPLNMEFGSEAPVPKKMKKNSDVNLFILKGTPKGEEKPINPTDSEEGFVAYLAQLLAKIPPQEKLEYQMELIAVLQRPLPSQTQATVTKEEGLIDSLISAVEARPGLWDSRLPLVARDRLTRANLWQDVVNELGGAISTDEVKRKFKNLRDKYIKEKTLIDSGALKRPWVHFQKLQFLNEALYYTPVESFTSINDETDMPADHAYGLPDEPESEVDNERHISKKMKKHSDPNLLFLEEIPHIGEVPNETTTSDECFVAYLAQLLAKIPPEEKLEYKMELIAVLQRPLASQRQNTGS